MRQNLDERKKSAMQWYSYQLALPHVDMIMFSLVVQHGDLWVGVFQWASWVLQLTMSLLINLLNCHLILLLEKKFHHFYGVDECKRLGQYMFDSITLDVSYFNKCNTCNIINLVALPLMEGSLHVSIICLIDFHDIVVPPYINPYLI